MTRFRWLVPLLSVVILTTAVSSWAGVFVSVAIGPPALPAYSQPICPAPGYIWTPGYWAYGPAGYYWVPGTWVVPPQVGFLWTPGYWGFSAGLYNWHAGFWGTTIGFYGGINYGFGYPGSGYYGGYWRGRDFYYNRSANNVNITNIHNVYNQTVVNNLNANRVSYNGGPHGIQARPTSQQLAAERGQHIAATSMQMQHEQAAGNDRSQLASMNHGAPAVTATPRPGEFNSRAASQIRTPEAGTSATRAVHDVPRPPQNYQQARTADNVSRPEQNNRPQEQVAHNVPRPPENRQQFSARENARPAGNNAYQPAAQSQERASNRAPQQTRNVPSPNLQRSNAQAHAQSQPRQAYSPPRQAAPQVHAAVHPQAQHMTQRSPNAHQAAAHSSGSAGGHEQHQRH
ncbi:MAG TPA: hypothetical protein VE779_12020 [Candidatus Angelobacter sp.]|nr:hypothetical protein [Candidatus Angelobacter sp.]